MIGSSTPRLDAPVPVDLIARVAKRRAEENLAKAEGKRASRPKTKA